MLKFHRDMAVSPSPLTERVSWDQAGTFGSDRRNDQGEVTGAQKRGRGLDFLVKDTLVNKQKKYIECIWYVHEYLVYKGHWCHHVGGGACVCLCWCASVQIAFHCCIILYWRMNRSPSPCRDKYKNKTFVSGISCSCQQVLSSTLLPLRVAPGWWKDTFKNEVRSDGCSLVGDGHCFLQTWWLILASPPKHTWSNGGGFLDVFYLV